MSLLLVLVLVADAPSWDFSDARDHGWKPLNQVVDWEPSLGLHFRSRGEDPYLESPSFEHAASPHDELQVQLSTSCGGGGQVFWKVAGGGWYAEDRSLRFQVDTPREAVWVRIPVGEHPGWTGKILQLRLDPCEQAAEVCLHSVRVVRNPPPPVDGDVHVERRGRDAFRIVVEAHATESFDAAAAPPTVRLHLAPAARIEQGSEEADLGLHGCGDRGQAEWTVRATEIGVWPASVWFAGEWRTVPLAVPPEAFAPAEERGRLGEKDAYLTSKTSAILCAGCGFFLYVRRGEEWVLAGSGDFGLCAVFGSRATLERPPIFEPRWAPPHEFLRGTGVCGDVSIAVRGAGFEVKVDGIGVGKRGALWHLPVVRYRPGDGSFGGKHAGAILPGLEYLSGGEVSSSKLDCETPDHVRLAPDRLKVTAPFMAVAGGGTVSGLIWDASEPLSPVFDVPNRLEGGDSSLLGLMFPPVPEGTRENRLRASRAITEEDGPVPSFAFTLFALPGHGVTDAVRQFLEHGGVPDPGETERPGDDQAALSLLAFLDRPLYDEAVKGWGHCQEPNWGRAPAADVCYLLDLHAESSPPRLAERLRKRCAEVLERIPPEQRLLSGISHVRPEAVTLRLGGTAEALSGLKTAADAAVAEMREDGSWKYEGQYARGHFEDTALGICAPRVIQLLRYVRLTGSPRHLDAAKRALARLDRFDVPRGAQTWEVPLHTPDILASAQAVEAFVLACELTRDRAYLESAERWAWTGVPFVYLWGDLPVMRYATIPVFGATNWQAPVWFGTPVQWCGLVYAWSLYRLAAHRPEGPWRRIADGITISGMQQQYPDGAKAGCFPDVFYLRAQQRAGPTINPAPLLVLQVSLEGRNPDLEQTWVGDLRMVHLPGLRDVSVADGKLSFTLPEGARAQEVVVVGAVLEAERAQVLREEGSLACVVALPSPGRYELPIAR